MLDKIKTMEPDRGAKTLNSKTNFDCLKYRDETDELKTLLEDLMTAYGKEVWNYVFSITRKRDIADDITQEVFIKVYLHLDSFRTGSSFKTWLFTITRNTTIDFQRSPFFRKVTLFDWPEELRWGRSVEQEALEKWTLNEIWAMVLRLPVNYREAIILFAHHQLSMKEMADVLGVTESAVRTRLFRARQKLAKMRMISDYGSV